MALNPVAPAIYEQTSPGDNLSLEASLGVQEGWDAPIQIWSSAKPFESTPPPRAYHRLTVRLGSARGLSFRDAAHAWRPTPMGAGLTIRPAEARVALSSANPVRFADICLPVELTRQLCRSLFVDCEPIRPFGLDLIFCSDERLGAEAAALVHRALDPQTLPTSFEMNARTHLIALDLLRRHSPLSPCHERGAGGLAPWQARRAKELMLKNLAEDPCLTDIARKCQLSVWHFSRSFRKTFGAPPYRWLQTCRVEQAKALLRDAQRPLAEIAIDCGFTEQSHFTKVFTRLVGVSPGAWRRMNRA